MHEHKGTLLQIKYLHQFCKNKQRLIDYVYKEVASVWQSTVLRPILCNLTCLFACLQLMNGR